AGQIRDPHSAATAFDRQWLEWPSSRGLQGGVASAMTKIMHFILLLAFALCCMAQSQDGTAQQSASDTGLVPLSAPYTISTAPHFAVLVEFPRADSIRRIALGDSNYFLAEA